MPLSPGTRVGSYQLVALVGRGGMGEVYRAHDAKLGRDVALKVLPDAFTRDPGRRARFEREARLLASLNHPNIATLHGLESADGMGCLVMELVPGATLAERLERGPLGVNEALPLLQQIAAALEAAHDNGIVHRDLKPANIKITPEGRAKVLDFGLAMSVAGAADSPDLSQSPTVLQSVSAIGSITGTAAYMSPEQARGEPVDRRTDIWAFGCVGYEALSGRKAFRGSTLTDVLADVTRGEPDWTAINGVPGRIRDLLRRCLRKEKDRRLQSIADARVEIEDAIAELQSPAIPAAASRAGGRRAVYAAVAVLVAAVVALAAFRYLRPLGGVAQTTHLAVEIPPGSIGFYGAVLISPDGRTIVYGGSRGPLHRRRLDGATTEPIAGSDGALHPFFSPDGRWIAFFTTGKLRKVPLGGGLPQDLADIGSDSVLAGTSTGTWGSDGNIVFVQGGRPALWRVPAAGGTPERLAEPNAARKERSYLFPESLPGGKAILFTTRTDSGFAIALMNVATGERRVLIEGGRDARYTASGHIVFWEDFALRAVPFDAARLAVTGPPATVVEDVSPLGGGGSSYSISANGSLAYFPAFENKIDRSLGWAEAGARFTPLAESRQNLYVFPLLSPDGRQALVRFEGPGDCYLNTFDLARGSWSRLTFLGDTHSAAWSPDGSRVAFESERADGVTLIVVPAAGGAEQAVYVSDHALGSPSWTADSQFIAFHEESAERSWDINVVRAAAGSRPQPFLQTPFAERDPAISPDGKWIAYRSNESGMFEICVRPFPGPGPKQVISVGGGQLPRWARGGRQLFYRAGNAMMSVDIDTAHGFTAGKPKEVLSGDFYGGYDVSADGERLLVVKSKSTPASSQIQVILNWFGELKARVATG